MPLTSGTRGTGNLSSSRRAPQQVVVSAADVAVGGLYFVEVQAFFMNPLVCTCLGGGLRGALRIAGALLLATMLAPCVLKAQDTPPSESPPARTDSMRTVALEELEITAERQMHLTRTRLQASRVRMTTFRDAADALSTALGVRMRRYGLTGLATLGMRGGDAAHTAILLGGMPLVHPQTGSMDVSLIPTALVADALLSAGPSESSLSMGGSVELEGPARGRGDRSEQAVHARTGLWGERGFGADVTEVLGTVRLRMVGDASVVGGDFPFRNEFLEGRPTVRREGASRTWESGAVVLSNAETADWPSWELMALASRSDRGLPGPSNAGQTNASQEDNLLRLQARMSDGMRWTASGAYTQWNLDFDPGRGAALGVSASHLTARTAAVHVASGHRTHSARSEVRPSLRAEYTDAAGHRDWTAEPGVAATRRANRVTLDVFSRLVASNRSPVVPAAGATVSAPVRLPVAGRMELEAGLSRTVRLPSAGERYHVPGGNPDLRAERGRTAQLSVGTPTPIGMLRVTAFRSLLVDRILWRPLFAGPGLQVFHPENVGRVRSMGIEWAFSGAAQGARASVSWRARATHVRAEDISDARAPSHGHQLRYTPVTSATGEVRVAVGAVSGGITSQWETRRFITSDESSWLNAYHTMELDARADGQVLGVRMALWVRIHNITNTTYESMRLYPMPPRHVQVGIHIKRDNP